MVNKIFNKTRILSYDRKFIKNNKFMRVSNTLVVIKGGEYVIKPRLPNLFWGTFYTANELRMIAKELDKINKIAKQ